MRTIEKFTQRNHRLIGFLFGLAVHPAVQGVLALVRP